MTETIIRDVNELFGGLPVLIPMTDAATRLAMKRHRPNLYKLHSGAWASGFIVNGVRP